MLLQLKFPHGRWRWSACNRKILTPPSNASNVSLSLLVILITIIGQETCMASHWKSVGIKKTNWKIKKINLLQNRKETDYDEFDDCLVSHTQLFGKIKKKGLSSHLVFLQTMSCFLNSRSQWHQGIHGIQGSMRICEFFQCQGKQEFLV